MLQSNNITYDMLQDEATIVAAAILLVFVELPGGHATEQACKSGRTLATV